MLKDIIRSLFILLLISVWSWTYVNGQTPSTQPTTQPSDSTVIEIDTSGISSPFPDSTLIDTSRISSPFTDSTKIGRRPPPRKKEKAPQEILTNDVYYYYHDQPNQIFEFKDTTLNTLFFQYDPERDQKFDYASIGAVGGPLQPLQYRWQDKFGTRFGLDEVFKPYIKDETEIPFFTKSKAFSDLFYSQGVEQNDHIFHGTFGRSFDNGIQFSLTHDRLIHSLNNADIMLNDNAFYTTAATKNTSLLTGLSFQKRGSKYKAFLTYAHNEINQLYNGGIITNDTIFTTNLLDSLITNADDENIGFSIPTNISGESANLRYRFRTIAYDHYLTLAGPVDSLSGSSRIYNLNHKIRYISDVYRFSDTSQDSLYYQILNTDERGLRVAVNQKVIENYVGLSTQKTKNGKIIPSILGDISLGLRHQYALIDGEVYEKQFNNLFAEGAWKVTPFKALTLDVFSQIGVLENIGDFRLNASATLSLDKWGILEGRLRQQRFNPTIYEEQNFVTQIEVWNNDFDKSFNSELGFTYRLPSFELEAGLSYFLLDNHIYFSDDFVPVQRNGAINILQIYVQKNFNWKILHLENLAVLQSSTDDDVIRFPNWWSKHSLYVQRRIFNRIMLARLGLDLRLSSTYLANGFNPGLAQFYVQNEREVKLYPAVDAHFGFVVDKFRIFFKMENLTTFVTKDIFYQIPYYPQKEIAFRFGVSWRFLDQHSKKQGSQNENANPNQNNNSPPAGIGRG